MLPPPCSRIAKNVIKADIAVDLRIGTPIQPQGGHDRAGERRVGLGTEAIADCAPLSGARPLAVRLRSLGEFTGGSIVRYRWDFQGDGVYDTQAFDPALADDLSGLPAAYLSTGALDLFLDEDLDYARRLIDCGVPTELHVYPGAIHAFEMVPGTGLSLHTCLGELELLAGGPHTLPPGTRLQQGRQGGQ